MAAVGQKRLVMNDSLMIVALVLEDRPEIPMEKLKEISRQVSGTPDRETMRTRILELADAL